MARVVPTENFDGYPDNVTRTAYQAGVEATVPESYAKLLVAKGLAERVKKAPEAEE